MTQITLDKAQQDLPDLVARALAGEEVVIVAADKLVRLEVVAPTRIDAMEFDEEVARRRGYGILKGQFLVGPEFFEPLSDAECGYGDDKGGA